MPSSMPETERALHVRLHRGIEYAATRLLTASRDAEWREVLAILRGDTHFQCPACGKSFEVNSETSERIFCSGACKRLTS